MIDNPTHLIGIDPGFTGAICAIDIGGTVVQFWDMPVVGEGRQRELDFAAIDRIISQLQTLPKSYVGLEWPTTRPGEGAERCLRFGRQLGCLETFLFTSGLVYSKIPPNLWKGRLGIPGKTDPQANPRAAALFSRYYPSVAVEIRGPRGGILDGRCDAALIAHWLRTQHIEGMRAVVDQFGKDSPEALALLLGPCRRGRRKCAKPHGF